MSHTHPSTGDNETDSMVCMKTTMQHPEQTIAPDNSPMKILVPALLRIKPDALDKLGKYLRTLNMGKVCLFYGHGLTDQLHKRVQGSCRLWDIEILHHSEISTTHSQELFELSNRLPSDTSGIAAIGGGRAIDACKYLSHLRQIPVLACPTIVSNDGFASPFSSLLFEGEKRTVPTSPPQGIVVDTIIASQAPVRFYYSGIGDLVSNLTAIADWKFAYHQTGTYVDDFAVAVAQTAAENFIHAPGKSPSSLASLQTLATGLMLSGIAMDVAGSSRPASGSEHLISHAYDAIQIPNSSLHGLQVGVASLAVSFIQQRSHEAVKAFLIETGFVEFMTRHPLNRRSFIEAIHRAPSMKNDFCTVLSLAENRVALLDYVDHDELMQSMLAPETN